MADSRMNPTPNDRRAYEAPRLTVYGAVKDLTAGGSEPQREQVREGLPLDNGSRP